MGKAELENDIPNNTKYGQINPSKLLLESMADDNNQGEEEDGNVDANLSIGNDLFSMNHVGG